MSSLRDIKKRIRSVKSSQKITRAMKLVAASKLRRAQEAMLSARPYAEALSDLAGRLVPLCQSAGDAPVHPLLGAYEGPARTLLVVFGSQRGSCGAFNTSLFRRTERLLRESGQSLGDVSIMPVGKKSREYFARRPKTQVVELDAQVASALSTAGDMAACQAFAQKLAHYFENAGFTQVMLVYNRFVSAMVQQALIEPLLPIACEQKDEAGTGIKPLCEPSVPELLAEVLPRLLTTQLWRATLESNAAEHAARMTAMDSATNNAQELVESYTLQYNRARQAAITLELMDIVGGAEALAG